MLLFKKILIATLITSPLLLIPAKADNICSKEKKSDILSPITKENHTVSIDCNLTLDSHDVITKKVLFEGERSSNTYLNCNNALIDLTVGIEAGIFTAQTEDTIAIQSVQKADNTWSVPHDIHIQDCQIKGSIRLTGMKNDAQSNPMTSFEIGMNHTKRANLAAPHRISLKNINIEGLYRPTLYLSEGVNHVTLEHSNLQGVSNTVALYLDAESNFNNINNNTIHVNTQQQLMSLNGSAHNVIKNNHLTLNDNGGIYLFHRCDQENPLLHQSTSLNQIEANYFTLEHISNHPSINLNARRGEQNNCSNAHADTLNNTIIYNQFLHTDPKDVITFDNISTLQKHENTEDILSSYANISVTEFRTDAVAEVEEFECFIEGADPSGYGGIACIIQCPSNKINASIRVGCDLEDFMFEGYNAAIPNSDDPRCTGCSGDTANTHYQREFIDTISWNHMVIRNEEDCENPEAGTCGGVDPDDIRGLCMVDDISASTEESHTHLIPSYTNETLVACHETDGNGGDCMASGQILCL
ncbi:hypothetical protein [uncultured Shewanella sp.]|uniref:hypothetical protein n=1 Tax=uncultured Shewanella sp. TaxID=173975 RepID=UPI00260E27F5|nr:hypothetical protein [uncultured Shewanella sp.]